MSSVSSMAALVHTVYLQYICAYTPSALAFYEYVITFSLEVDLFWLRPVSSGATIIFLLNRYVLLFNAVANIMGAIPLTSALSCKAIIIISLVANIAAIAIAAVFSALRTYAVGRLDKRPALLVFAFGLVPVVINMYVLANAYPYVFSVNTSMACGISSPIAGSTFFELSIVMSVATIISDMIAIVTTWKHTIFQSGFASRYFDSKPSIMSVVLADGTAYFITDLTLQILQFALMYQNEKSSYFTDYAPSFISILPYILISRFIINLRIASESTRPLSQLNSEGLNAQTDNLTTILFRGLGGPLDHGLTFAVEDELLSD